MLQERHETAIPGRGDQAHLVARLGERAEGERRDEDPDERPWIGKVMWTLDADANGVADSKIMGYVRIVGTDTETSEFAWVTGIVTKGDAAGATTGRATHGIDIH